MNMSSGTPWSLTALAFGFDLAVKATALVVIVLMIQHVVGRRRALLGSAIGNAGLIGLLLLPFSAMLFASVPVACLPREARAPKANAMSEFISTSMNALPREFAEAPMPSTQAWEHATYASESKAKLVRRAIAVPAVPAAPRTIVDASAAGSTQNWRTDWAAIAIVGYIIGTLVSLVRISTSIRDVARLKHSLATVDDTVWTEALDRWRRKLGIGHDVALTWSPRLSVPVVVGWLRPAIVLPSSLMGADGLKHADSVLLHELAHVRRADYLWNLVSRLVQALYWPHVLVWVLARTIAEMRERACDDLCVHEMGGPSAYRETLLAVASGMLRRPSPAMGMAMAQPSKLGRRLARIERTKGDDHCLPRWPVRLAIVATAITATWMIGAIRLVQTEARTTSLDDPPKTTKAADPAPPSDKAGRVFHLQVVAADTGKPVPDADVRVWISLNDFWRKTDAQGHLDVTHSTGPSDRSFSIDVWGEGRAMQRHYWGNAPNKPIPDSETIKLQPGESLGGLVRDEAGRPIAGAAIYLWSHNYKKRDPHELLFDLRAVTGPDGKWQTSGAPETTGELLGFRIIHPDFLSSRDYQQKEIIPKIADLRAGKAITVMKKGVPIEGRVFGVDGQPVAGARVLSTDNQGAMFTNVNEFAASTGADGRFRTWQVKPGEWFLVASAKGHAPGDRQVKIGSAVPQVEITLGRPLPFKGRVVDSDGKPIAGAFINPDAWRGYRCLGAFLWTDADGRFRWDDAPNDELIINVSQTGYRGVFQQTVSPSTEDVVFTLKPSLTIRGTLTDAETKTKVDNATVEYSAVDPKTGDSSAWTSLPSTGFSTGLFQGRLDAGFPVTADAYKIRVHSPGFQTFVSRTFRREEKLVLDYDIALVPGQPLGSVATVFRSDGKPLAGARVYSTPLNEGFNVEDGRVIGRGGNGREDRTGLDGTFPMPQSDQPWFLLILGDDEFASASKEELAKSPKIVAKPYAQVVGRCLLGTRVMINQEVELSGMLLNRSARNCNVHLSQKTKTDQEGRFTFRRVVPDGSFRVKRLDPEARAKRVWWIGEPVRVEPGATTRMTLGGKGRPVIGRVEPPSGWTSPIDFTDRSEAHLVSNRPVMPYPPLSLLRGKTSMAGSDVMGWRQRYRESPESRDFSDSQVSIGASIGPDGSFRIDDVPPGEYRMGIRVNGNPTVHVTVQRRRESGPFARKVQTFAVPPIPGGRSDQPLDLGVMRLQPRVSLKSGDPAPAFEVTTVDGKKLAVPGDYHGKFVLVEFGTQWDIQAAHSITLLNDMNQKFGKDPRFAILSLTFAADNADTRKFIEEKGESWTQAIVGPFANPIASAYGIDDENASTSTLIGPDGRIVATELWHNNIGETISKALGLAAK